MSDFLNQIADYSPKRLALLANQLKQRVEALEAAEREPIAIVGMACRFPGGADTPELYWDLIRAGKDAIVETPADRWDVDAYFDPDPDAPGKLASRSGGFLSRVDEFDPEMFGIAPREAQNMDPQQRLLLEVAWEALENAGIPAGDLSRLSAGIFIGLSGFDYYQELRRNDLASFDAYAASGAAHSIASGRLAYVLGARGPALSIDTACSSSLVAAHVAIQSLRSRECDMAIAGGVNLILAPDTTVALSKAHMMAPDGRCKAFDARADGFVRGEGCGVLVFKRLSDAQAAGDPIIAVIRGTACNQDGRSNGLTAPNGAAQEALLKAALKNAGAEPDAVAYVEAHGTGTKLGDPIEVLALDAAFGRNRRGSALRTGSVKANIGHLESAAGAAGLIKLALMLKHGVIPRQIHFDTPNPHIPWDAIGVSVPRVEMAWPASNAGVPRLAGVSSFGFSGTNVHLILEQAPRPQPRPSALPHASHVVTASARSDVALDRLMAGYASAIVQPGTDFDTFARTANAGRTHMQRRAAVVAADAKQAAERFTALRQGEGGPSMYLSTGGARSPKVAFLFTGQGAQYIGMAKGLFETQPVFQAAFAKCDELLKTLWPLSLRAIVFDQANDQAVRLQDTTIAQPALFAVEYALAQLWASWGVHPVAVAGHSLGEISAACVAGLLSLEDALKLTVARGRLMGALPRNGAMVAVMATEQQVSTAIERYAATVSIAALNGPANTVISGEAEAVHRITADLRGQGITVTPLSVSHAFHSPLMDPILDDFLVEAKGVTWQTPQIELISNVTGSSAGGAAAHPEYWRDHVRMPVRFADSISTLARMGCNTFIEIGPHPVLIAMAQDCVPTLPANWIASLRRGGDDNVTILNALASLYVAGGEIDWRGMDAPYTPGQARLPNYPFQRERYWVSGGQTAATDAVEADANQRPDRKSAGTRSTLSPAIAELLHEIVWRRADALRLDDIATALAPNVQAAANAPVLAAYERFALKLDRLCTLYIVRCLRGLGWPVAVGSTAASRDLAERLVVLPRHRRLFARLVEILQEDGVLEQNAGIWRVVQVPAEDAEAFADDMLAAHPDCDAELTLTRRCGRSLADVMRGDVDPLTLLFPGGSLADTERLYQSSPPAQIYNKLVADAVGAIADSAGGRPLRILEVGAGTGSTTAHVLPRLRAATYEYTFTDVSPLFLNKAREKFADMPAMKYELLDLEHDLAGQGFEIGTFDVVIGANVVHATRDLACSAIRLRTLLATGGRLVLLEGMTPQRFGDLTVGLLEGWWAFTDTERRNYALMPRESWHSLLTGAGFSAVTAVPPKGHGVILDQQAVLVADAAPAPPSTWLLQPDQGGVAERLAETLQGRGFRTAILSSAGIEEDLRGLSGGARDTLGVVSLAALDRSAHQEGDDLVAGQEASLAPSLALVKALVSRAAPTRYYAVTRGAQAVRPGEAPEPAQATHWGFSHVVALEHPELACTRIDLDPAEEVTAAVEVLADELCFVSHEDQIARREAGRFARRLTTRPSRPERALAPAGTIDPNGAYLVTGGLRGLGLLVAEWLVDQGARVVALMGRSEPGEREKAAVARIEERGTRVLVLRRDVTLKDDVERSLSEIAATGVPLKGVFHCAGVLDDGVLISQSWNRFAHVLAPKVQGAWNLHTLCSDLDLFVMFSSGASVSGSAGQANHAAANAFEDALAWMRQAEGYPTLAINWGPWAEYGAAADRTMSSAGGFLRAMSPRDGLSALSACLWRAAGQRLFEPAQLAVFDADWSAFAEVTTGLATSPLFGFIASETATSADRERPVQRVQSETRNWRNRILAAPENRRRTVLRDEVRMLAAKVLGSPAKSLDVDEPLRDLGLDSLMAVELRNRISTAVGRTLPATITFDFPTVAALTAYLIDEKAIDLGETSPDDPKTGTILATDKYANQSEGELAAALAAKLDALQLMNKVS
jgi:microcystin synthetase protein McyG